MAREDERVIVAPNPLPSSVDWKEVESVLGVRIESRPPTLVEALERGIEHGRRRPERTMKNRVVRVSDKVWDAAKERADEKGETVSEAVRKFLERYGR